MLELIVSLICIWQCLNCPESQQFFKLSDKMWKHFPLSVFLVSRCYIYGSFSLPQFQVTMVNKKKNKKGFSDLGSEDLDLTMFTITDLTLNKEEEANMV